MIKIESINKLEALAQRSTKLDLDTAEIVRDESGKYSECPMCGGDGTVDAENEYVNFDGVAIGVQFYGIGKEFGYAEEYFRAVLPSEIIKIVHSYRALLGAAKLALIIAEAHIADIQNDETRALMMAELDSVRELAGGGE